VIDLLAGGSYRKTFFISAFVLYYPSGQNCRKALYFERRINKKRTPSDFFLAIFPTWIKEHNTPRQVLNPSQPHNNSK